VLDVGCGPGSDTLALARLVGPTGQVVGVDYDGAMVAEAEKRAAQASCSAWCHHYQADAAALPLPSNSVDAARSERVFQHVTNPAAILAEMARVTKPGGWVVVLDADWSTLSIATPEVDLERRLNRYRLEHVLTNGSVGRRLYGLFNAQQFTDIVVEPRPIFVTDYAVGRYATLADLVESGALAAGEISQEELQRWRQSLEQAQVERAFFLHLLTVLVAGRCAETTAR
jgi:ubiquinone/menaquinone biosynthesis C-methylase UbiE